MYSFYIYKTPVNSLSHTLFAWLICYFYLFVHLFMKHHTSLGHIADFLDTKVVKSVGWGQNPSFNPDSVSYFLYYLG